MAKSTKKQVKEVEDKPKQSSINSLTINEKFRLADLHFNRMNVIFSHLYNSYDKFLDDVKNMLLYGKNEFASASSAKQHYKYGFIFTNVKIMSPTKSNGVTPIYPEDARYNNLTYSATIFADVVQYQEIRDLSTNKVTVRHIGEVEKKAPVAYIPMMVRSRYCNLVTQRKENNHECDYDPGGYFLVNGNEKVLISQDSMTKCKPMVYSKKDAGNNTLYVQINSVSYKINGMSQIIMIKMKNDGIMTIRVPILNELNVVALLRALGLEKDNDIIRYVCRNNTDTEMINVIRESINNCVNEKTKKLIYNREEAIDYIISKMKSGKRFLENSTQEEKMTEKKLHLMHFLQEGLLPHVDGTMMDKAYTLCYMIGKLLKCHLKREPLDDRDSYVNKRVDLPGDLMFEMFKQQYKKMMSECGKFFNTRNKSHTEPIPVVHHIKPNIIEQGFKTALSNGQWIRHQGVAQVLPRLTYIATLCALRRLDTPSGGDASKQKLTSPRHLHHSSVPFLCVVESPEHAHIGLVKHYALIGTVTIMTLDLYLIVKKYVMSKIIKISQLSKDRLSDLSIYRVLVNGEWVGFSETPYELYNDLQDKKMTGILDYQNVSIVADHDQCEIRVYCDSGRLVRPAIRVVDNVLQLTDKHIKAISLKNTSVANKVSDWNEFMLKHSGVIEYIDMEQQPYLLIADVPEEVERNRIDMTTSVDKVKNTKMALVENRYDNMFFKKYTHCEIHPSLLLGELIASVPFCNFEQGARAVYQYAQAKQAMGLYITTYRHRLDISFILYHTQRRIVNTRASKYTNAELLPSGENCIVAILCYTGFNQEDSLIANATAIERGKFRATSLKKAISQLDKKSALDEVFAKPDKDKVIGIKHGSYEKLNEQGFVPEETQVVNGDALIAKITPLSERTKKGQEFKDSSEIYKSNAAGVVDRVYIDIMNQDGNETRKMLVRSERIPNIGDKFCSPYGQKGTIGAKVDCVDMPYTAEGIVPDLIINPHAIPSRMTASQLIESLVGKLGALMGMEVDGTPFEKIDLHDIGKKLEALGYQSNGCEWLYSGMTGKKMQHQIFIGPTYYHRLKHLVEDKVHCLTPSHEVLTSEGYVPISQITSSDLVACLIHGNIEYHNPIAVLKYDYYGNMYNVTSQYVDLCTTLEHRMWLSYDGVTYRFEKVNEMREESAYFMNTAIWNGPEIPLQYPNKWLTFFGQLCVRGWTDSESNIMCISAEQTIVTALSESLETILDYSSYNYINGCFIVTDKIMSAYASIFVNDCECIATPKWMTMLSASQSKLLLNGMFLAGNVYTSSKHLVDTINTVALHAGEWVFADMIEPDDKITPSKIYCIKRMTEIPVVAPTDCGKHIYKGNVYCLEVPGETFYVRNKLKGVWTGNSRARGPKTHLTRQPAEGRSRDGGLRIGSMERDCLCAHGISKFIIEKMLMDSDVYVTYVCDKCGLFAQRFTKENSKPDASPNDIYYCEPCNNYSKISKITIPYAFKLLVHHLMAMCILPRIRTQQKLFV